MPFPARRNELDPLCQTRASPITPQRMIATLYQALGIDPATTIPDHNGRPVYLVDERAQIEELV